MQSLWNGSLLISGDVEVPVRVYPAVRETRVSFRQINRRTGNPITYRRCDSVTGEEIDYADVGRGYEIGDTIIPIDDDLIPAPPSSRVINLDHIARISSIDPLWLDRPYHLGASEGASRAYANLATALANISCMAIGLWYVRRRVHLCGVASNGVMMRLYTLHKRSAIINFSEEYGSPDADAVNSLSRKLSREAREFELPETDVEEATIAQAIAHLIATP